METLTSKEFFDQLKTNTLKPCSALKGIIKKSEKDSEVLFAIKGNLTNWVTIPASMIDSVNVLKTFSKEDTTFAVVKLHLKTPTTPEGKVYHELLSLFGKEEKQEGQCGCNNNAMDKHGCQGMQEKSCGETSGHYCHHCGCHQGHPGGCR